MATRTVSNTGGNWNATATWVGGVVPNSGDTVNFTATSGNLTVNVTSTCAGIDFTNYLNTITFTFDLFVQGPINLGTGGYTQAGTSGLLVNSNAGGTGFTSNGVIWSRKFTFSGGGTAAIYILNDDWNFTGTLLFTNTNTCTINGFNIYTNGLSSTSNQPTTGTTNIIFNGTGTWSHSAAGAIRNNVTINTAGTLTIGTNIYYNTGTLTYTAGTVITTGSTLNIAASTTLNTSGIIWDIIRTNNAITLTLLSNLNTTNLYLNNVLSFTLNGNNLSISGTLILGYTTGATTFNTPQNLQVTNLLLGNGFASNQTLNGLFTISVSGNLTQNQGVGTSSGTTSILLNGTGTWSNASTGALQNNLTINTAGTITISGNLYYNTGTLTYLSGKVITKNSTFNLTNTTTLINCHKINFDKVVITSGVTITMNEFFSGSAVLKTTISASSTTNYTITFQDGFEKIAKFVNISRATFTNKNQLLLITDSKKSSTNSGIRYINSSPNGVSKGEPSIQNTLTAGLGTFLVNDPNT